ncbi:MAG: hypothetical protein QOJ98_752, partial [Acidobacteriota bacterium]|nr:hypothetical protein [Acidobacteriota bacterium]
VTTGATVTGRTLARNGAVTLDTNAVTAPGQPISSVTTMVGGVERASSGASFWDLGTLGARLEAGLATRVLSTADASLAWANPSFLTFGDLNLLGPANPLGSLLPKSLLYGSVAGWTADRSIAWGTPIQDPGGEAIIWGTSGAYAIIWGTSDGEAIIWGTSIMTSADPH